MQLEDFKIEGLPETFYYIPEFISEAEEGSVLQKIPTNRWTHLSHRRLQAHPSTLTPNNTLLASPLPTYLSSPIISRFEALGVFTHTPHKTPNHVLINEYAPGQGIMPHEDGDAYAHVVATGGRGGGGERGDGGGGGGGSGSGGKDGDGEDGDDASTNQVRQAYRLPTRIYQEPRSLLITTGPAYTQTLHGISEVETDEGLCEGTVANWTLLGKETRERIERDGGRSQRGLRVSLTYRDVRRVSGALGKVFGGRRV